MHLQPDHSEPTNNAITITHVYDALCGWCYGFSPVIQQLHRAMHDYITRGPPLPESASVPPQTFTNN